MKTTKPSSTAERTASVVANTLNLKDSQVAGLALVIQAALEEYQWDRTLLLRALCEGTARWEPWSDPSQGELCINGLRYSTKVDGKGCPTLTPGIRHALVKTRNAKSV